MNMKEVGEELKKRLREGDFRLTLHAIEQMEHRFVLEDDIKSVGRTARRCLFQPEKDTWRVEGKDLDGERLVVVCALEQNVLIVTVF